jgi:hypothetical protein
VVSKAIGGQPQYGSKLRDLVAHIRGLPKNERCLVFVQFDDLMDVVARALEQGSVRAQQLKGSVHQKSAALGGFQRDEGGAGGHSCLLLNIGNESAAGANLTVANHAVFVHPILADSEHLYNVRALLARSRWVSTRARAPRRHARRAHPARRRLLRAPPPLASASVAVVGDAGDRADPALRPDQAGQHLPLHRRGLDRRGDRARPQPHHALLSAARPSRSAPGGRDGGTGDDDLTSSSALPVA